MAEEDVDVLSDDELLDSTSALNEVERSVCIRILSRLGAIDARRLHLKHGFPSLFAYCIEVLGYPEGTAMQRIAAARAMRAFPAVKAALSNGDISVTVAAMASKVLTAQNHMSLLEKLRGRSVFQAKEILAPWLPHESVPDTVRPLGGKGEPRYQIGFEADRPFTVKLHRVRELLSNKHPQGVGLAVAFDATMEEYLRRHDPEVRPSPPRVGSGAGAGVGVRAGSGRSSKNPKYIPAGLRRAVHKRDKGRCAYVGQDGRRCHSRWRLHVDHIVPLANKGKTVIENLRLLCAAHNDEEAKRILGTQYVRPIRTRKPRPRPRPP